MINIQSPTFSNSGKMDLLNKLSPSMRNKRIPSLQEGSNNNFHWNRVNSCKKLESASMAIERNRKRSHNSQQRVKSKINVSHNMAEQVTLLKNEYTSIKIAYQDLIQNKVKNDEEVSKNKQELRSLKEDNEKILKQNQKLKNKIIFLEMEIERIKRESFKLIEIQQFKVKKLEENLIQKQKAISTLVSSFQVQLSENPIRTQSEEPLEQNCRQKDSLPPNIHLPALILNHNKTLSNSQFISVSLTSVMQSENTKRNNTSYINQMGQNEKVIQIIETKINKQNKENENKVFQNLKKFRKEITKKIQVNVECKQSLQQNLLGKNTLDRKVSKSNKNSKTKLKKEDESVEHRSSKKKIVCK